MPPHATASSPAHRWRRRLLAPLVLGIGLVLSALASWRIGIAVRAEARAYFIGESERLATELVRRITQSSYALIGLRASMAATGRLGRLPFRSWVAERELAKEFPGIRGLGFIERVPRTGLADFIARERADHAPDFAVQTRGDAADLLVITHIEPIARNRPAVGLDVGAEPVRREAAERAIESGMLALTGPIVLVQDERQGPGWLLYLPVFRPGLAITSAAERRAALVGLVYSPIAAAEVLAPLGDFTEHRIHFQLFDGQGEGTALYDSADTAPQDRLRRPLLTSRRPLQIAGRVMTLQLASTPRFEARIASFTSGMVLLTGLALSLLLSVGVSRLQASRDAAEARSQQANRDLAENEKLIQLMIDSIPAQLSYWDRDLRCRIVNRAASVACERSRDELLGMPLAATPLGARFLANTDSAIEAALRGETQQRELAVTLPDGRRQITLSHFLPDRRGDEIPGIAILTLDISDLKNAQSEAQQASEAKSRFLSNMSHDMRTPMNAVIGMLQLARATPVNEKKDDYAMKAERAARSLLALINDLLDFSKIEAGKMTLDPRPFSLPTLLDDVAVLLRVGVGTKPVAIRIHCDPSIPPLLQGDELRLRQVLTNLGDNAIKFTHRGGVEVSADLLAQTNDHAELELSVRDTGIGIPPETQARLFGDYTQASQSTARRFGGTGLGLSICQRLVRLMGGELKVESAPGEGSRFFFRISLPRSQAEASSPLSKSGEKDEAKAQPLAGLRLLLVEDNELNQQLAVELLGARGALVTVLNNGQQAVERLEQDCTYFDAVLMDVQMPVMDGYTATKLIRQKIGGRLPIIAMTANAFESDREAALQAGMDGHLHKPIDIRMVVDTLLQQVGKRQRRSDDRLSPLAVPASPPTAPPAAPPAERPFIDRASAIERLLGDVELYNSLVPSFCERLRDTDAQLRRSPAAVPPAEQSRLLHSLNGMASTMGAYGLAQAAKQAEGASLASNEPLDPAAVQAVHTAIERTLAAFAGDA